MAGLNVSSLTDQATGEEVPVSDMVRIVEWSEGLTIKSSKTFIRYQDMLWRSQGATSDTPTVLLTDPSNHPSADMLNVAVDPQTLNKFMDFYLETLDFKDRMRSQVGDSGATIAVLGNDLLMGKAALSRTYAASSINNMDLLNTLHYEAVVSDSNFLPVKSTNLIRNGEMSWHQGIPVAILQPHSRIQYRVIAPKNKTKITLYHVLSAAQPSKVKVTAQSSNRETSVFDLHLVPLSTDSAIPMNVVTQFRGDTMEYNTQGEVVITVQNDSDKPYIHAGISFNDPIVFKNLAYRGLTLAAGSQSNKEFNNPIDIATNLHADTYILGFGTMAERANNPNVTEDEFIANYIALIRRIRSNYPNALIALINEPEDMRNEVYEGGSFNEALKTIAASERCMYIPLDIIAKGLDVGLVDYLRNKNVSQISNAIAFKLFGEPRTRTTQEISRQLMTNIEYGKFESPLVVSSDNVMTDKGRVLQAYSKEFKFDTPSVINSVCMALGKIRVETYSTAPAKTRMVMAIEVKIGENWVNLEEASIILRPDDEGYIQLATNAPIFEYGSTAARISITFTNEESDPVYTDDTGLSSALEVTELSIAYHYK